MGYEQKISFQGQSAAALDAILCDAPYFARYVPDYGLYEYRSDRNADLHWMPDAHLKVEPDGIYFCDNGGDSKVVRAVLDYLRATVERAGQPFELFELQDVE